MNTGWNAWSGGIAFHYIINLLGNEYWLEPVNVVDDLGFNYKPTGK